MFSTNFGGGYKAYAQRQSAVSKANKAQQKSQRISKATAGKKKTRKEENKGKHRKVKGGEITITSGTEKQGGTGYYPLKHLIVKAREDRLKV